MDPQLVCGPVIIDTLSFALRSLAIPNTFRLFKMLPGPSPFQIFAISLSTAYDTCSLPFPLTAPYDIY